MTCVPWSSAEEEVIAAHADCGVPSCVRALRRAGFDRSYQSVKAKRLRMGGCEAGTRWTPAQVAWLEQHWRTPVSALVEAINRLGPKRSPSNVAEKRRKLGFHITPAPLGSGWPRVAADPREQDRNYIRALLADLRRMNRSTDSSPDVLPVERLTRCEAAHNASEKLEAA